MQPVTSVLPAVVRRLLQQGEMSQEKLDFAWRAAVGPAIERATEVRLAADGTVEVRASDATWRRELQHSQSMMLGRLQELLGRQIVKNLKIMSRSGRRS